MSKAPFLGLPKGRHAAMALVFAGSFQLIWLLLYGGADWLAARVPWRIEVGFPFETQIPFVPAAALAYLSLGLMFGLVLFVRRRWEELFPVWIVLCLQTTIAAICFVLIPARTGFPAREAGGWIGAIFEFADAINLRNNFLPSLHVAYACTMVLAMQGRAGPWCRVGLWLWAGLIAASTLLMHEHQVVDVLAGAMLALLAWRVGAHWALRPARLRALQVELLCLRDLLLFARRHRRYVPIAVAVLGAGLGRWRERRLLRLGFCFLQHVDDLLDGDRAAPNEPLEIVDALMLALRSGRFGRGDLMQMARALRADLLLAGGERAVEQVLALLRVMRRDRERVMQGVRLPLAELQAHHRATFTGSVNLLLLACGSRWSADQIPELVDLLAWCSPVRDLSEDLSAGLVNIPREVLPPWPDESLPSFSTAIEQASVREWLRAEQVHAEMLLPRLAERLAQLREQQGPGDRLAWRALAMLTKALRTFTNRQLPRLYPFLANDDATPHRA